MAAGAQSLPAPPPRRGGNSRRVITARNAARPHPPIDRDTLTREVPRPPSRTEERSPDKLAYQFRRKLGRRGAGEVISALRNQGYAISRFLDA